MLLQLGLRLLVVILGFLEVHFKCLDAALVHSGLALRLDKLLLGPVLVCGKAIISLIELLDLTVSLGELDLKASFVGIGIAFEVTFSLLDQSCLFQLHMLHHLLGRSLIVLLKFDSLSLHSIS